MLFELEYLHVKLAGLVRDRLSILLLNLLFCLKVLVRDSFCLFCGVVLKLDN
jgi:hypothetical protein